MDEQQFKKIMIKVRALAKRQGEAISKEQVSDRFTSLNVDEGQFMLIYRYLEEESVTLYETEEERISASGSKDENDLSVSGEDGEYLNMYIKELDALNLPDKEERSAMIEEILKDRDLAKEKLPGLYLKEVTDVARLYAGQGVAVEDLIGEGNVSLLTGIGMLDCCETASEVDEFIMKLIMDSMESLIMEDFSEDEFDQRVVDRVNDLSDRSRELAEELERQVSIEDLVKELDQDEEYIRETIRLSGNAIPYIKGCKET